MASSSDIALAGVVVAGVVGVAAPAISASAAAYQQKRTLKHERARLDLAELRQVVDNALQAARLAGEALAYHAGGGLPPTLREHTEAVGYAGSRLSIRLGSDKPLPEAYAEVRAALGRWADSWNELDELREDMMNYELDEHFTALQDGFYKKLRHFEEAALDRVGSQLE